MHTAPPTADVHLAARVIQGQVLRTSLTHRVHAYMQQIYHVFVCCCRMIKFIFARTIQVEFTVEFCSNLLTNKGFRQPTTHVDFDSHTIGCPAKTAILGENVFSPSIYLLVAGCDAIIKAESAANL